MKITLKNKSDLDVCVYNPCTRQDLLIRPKTCVEVIVYNQAEVDYYRKGYRVFGIEVSEVKVQEPVAPKKSESKPQPFNNQNNPNRGKRRKSSL